MALADARSLRDTRIWPTSTPTAAASCRYSAISAGWPTEAGSAISVACGIGSVGPSKARSRRPRRAAPEVTRMISCPARCAVAI